MTGWNLPPGCTESMIPGNLPEDAEYERHWDELSGVVDEVFLSYLPRDTGDSVTDDEIDLDRLREALIEKIMALETKAQSEGYQMAIHDLEYEKYLNETEDLEERLGEN